MFADSRETSRRMVRVGSDRIDQTKTFEEFELETFVVLLVLRFVLILSLFLEILIRFVSIFAPVCVYDEYLNGDGVAGYFCEPISKRRPIEKIVRQEQKLSGGNNWKSKEFNAENVQSET